MSLKLERLIARVERLEAKRVKDRREINWLRDQLQNGLTDVTTASITKILEEGLEAVVVEDKEL